jgi:RNA polymerase sigma-70 factor (ECF subfamily)
MADQQEVWNQFTKSLRAFVSRRVPASDVNDVVQEIFLRAARGISGLRDDERTGAWLLTIARRVIADFYSKRPRSPVAKSDEPSGEHLDEQATQPANLEPYEGEHDVHEEVLSWLRPFAENIDEPYRTALIRADFEEIPQKQLAKELGLSDSGLKSRVQRARAMVGEALRRCCEVEFGEKGRAVAFRRLRDCC